MAVPAPKEALVPLIRSGRVLATIHQRPLTQGRMAFQALYKFLVEGQCPLPRIRVAPHIVMNSNLDLFLERMAPEAEEQGQDGSDKTDPDAGESSRKTRNNRKADYQHQ